MQYAIPAVIGFSLLFAALGIWLLASQRGSSRGRIESRLRGVRQVKRYELGDALAETREKEVKRKQQRQEALKRKAFSDIPALDKALKKVNVADVLSGKLLQAQIPITVTNFVLLSLMLGGLGVAVTVLWRRGLDPILAGLFALVLGGAPSVYVYFKVHKRLNKFSAQLPDALDLLSSSVKSGQSLNAAIQNVADEMPDPVADEFRVISDELTFGVSYEGALQHLMARVNTPDVRFFATALIIQKETGGNLSEVLDGLQKTIRDRFRILGQVRTLTAQGKLSGLIVGLLPIVLGVFIYFANPGYMQPLFTEPLGHKMLAIAVGLQLTGVFLISRIVRIKV